MAAAGIGGVVWGQDLPFVVCWDDDNDPVLPDDVDDDDKSGRFSAGLLLRNESTIVGRTGRIVCIPMMVPFGGNLPVIVGAARPVFVVCSATTDESGKHCLKFCENYECGFLRWPEPS